MSTKDIDFDEKRLEQLLDLMAEDELSDENIEELQEILLSSEQARQKYINFNFVDDSLHWSYAEAALDNKRENSYFRESVVDNEPVKFKPWYWLAVAAVFAVALSILFVPGGQKDSVLAVIAESKGAVWEKNHKSDLTEGSLKLVEGEAKIIFKSGAEMTMKAPVEVELKSYIHARLARGKVKLYAPKTAIGFRLETEASNFVDIGTEFEVSVDNDNNSEIHVLDGVVVARSKYSDEVYPLGKNEAGRIDSTYGKIVPFKKRYFENPLLAPTGESVPWLTKDSRVIFIGERNTDFETYLHMVNQAIYDYDPQNAPTLINAGLTYSLGEQNNDYEEFIAAMKPTHAVLALASFRPVYNINHSREWFTKSVTDLCNRLEQDKVIPIIHIGIPAKNTPEALKNFKMYNSVLFKIANERSYRVARADTIWEQYIESGKESNLSMTKGLLFSYEGDKVFARSLLDVLGYRGQEVPQKLRLKPLPGIIKDWVYKEYVEPEKLSAENVNSIDTAGWERISLPMDLKKGYTSRMLNPYMNHGYQTKQLGYALEMNGVYTNTLRAVSHFESQGGEKYLNIGGGVKEIWLNGKLIKGGLTNMYLDGRHPGARRYKVKLNEGQNTIVLDCTMTFFVSLTDDNLWGLPHPVKE